MARWTFEPILDSYPAVLLLAALLLIVLLLVRPVRDRWFGRRNVLLLLLRTALILLLILAMLRPTRISTQTRPQSATLLLLYDRSRSMQVEDATRGVSRWVALTESLQASAAELKEISQNLDLRVYSFADQLQDTEVQEGKVRLPPRADGAQTNIGAALDEALRREMGKRLAAVILLSDGAQRTYDPRVDLQQVARDLARRDCPLYTVIFGKPREQSQSRDISIENLQDQYTIFVKNELEIRGMLRVQGYVNQEIPVQVQVQGPDGQTQQLGPVQVSVSQDDSLAEFRFTYSPQQPGAYTLQFEAAPQPGELVVDNNRLTAYLTALDGGLRVLYLEANLLGPEQQILRRSIGASPDIQLDYRPIDPRLRDQWPVDLSTEWQQPHDVYLIGDVDASALGEANLQQIADRIQAGKGLMMMGGLHTFGPGGYRNTPLAPLLPITMGRFERQELGPDAPIREDLHLPGPLAMLPTRPHFITRLAPESQNRERWQQLRPLAGANRFDSINPRANLLAESQNGDPLLIAWQIGAGRVLIFAGDSTHRWWRFGQQQAHLRFWRQAMLWLGNKDELMRRDVWIRLARRRFRPGERIEFTAGARDTNGDVFQDATLTVELVSPNGQRSPVRLTREGEDWSGTWESLEEPGEYQMEVTAQVAGESIGQNSARFTVQDLDLELSDPAANPEQLLQMSRVTQDAGGRGMTPEELPALLQKLRQEPPEMEIDVESKWRLGDSRWDAWTFFLVFVGLLTGEWFLRKEMGNGLSHPSAISRA